MTIWNQRGVPKKGWRCTDVLDLGADGSEYAAGTCEMCRKHPLRYIHTMEHDEHDALEVGSVCAEKMAEDYDAKAAEKKLKNKAMAKARWLSRGWHTSQNGNPTLRLHGLTVGVFSLAGRWKFWITKPQQKPQFSNRRYKTEDQAKLALFEAYWQAKQ